MEKSLTILLVEDEETECESFARYIDSVEDVCLIGRTNSAENALKNTQDLMPDAVILDLELHKGTGNGLAYLEALKYEQTMSMPYVLVTTNNVSRITHEKVRQLGADFIMLKSQEDYCAEKVVQFLLSLKDVIHNSQKKQRGNAKKSESPDEKRKRLTMRVSSETDLVGISPKATGRKYIIDSIMLIIEGHQNYIEEIAVKYKKTDASVERAMQNAINSAWRTNDIEVLQNCYTARIASARGVPTITEFIYYYVNKLTTEY